MGCTSSVNVRTDENAEKKEDGIIVNGKHLKISEQNIPDKANKNCSKIEEQSEENQEDSHMTNVMSLPKSSNKQEPKNKKKKKKNNNQSTNFQFQRDICSGLQKSNQTENLEQNRNKTDETNSKSQSKCIVIHHPLDNLEDKEIDINQYKNLNINDEMDVKEDINSNNNIGVKEENNYQNNADHNKISNNFNNKIEVTNSIEGRINEWNGPKEKNGDGDDEDMMNYGGMEDDDMCNLGQSVEIKKGQNKNKKIEEDIKDKEIIIIFEIQSSNEKYHIKADPSIKLFDLIEKFKKKINLPSYERPEFVFNTEYLIDLDKPISDYKIKNESQINVFI